MVPAPPEPVSCRVLLVAAAAPPVPVTTMLVPPAPPAPKAEAVVRLMHAPQEKLTRSVYNIGAFAPTCDQVQTTVQSAFPGVAITTAVDAKRQGIVDSWPADVDDTAARTDWGHAPKYNYDTAFQEYLIPAIRQRYAR